jgi:hypothetical protein
MIELTRHIGSVFYIDGVKLEVVEKIVCDGCYFYKNDTISCTRNSRQTDITGSCGCTVRSDGRSVIFKRKMINWEVLL